MKQADLVERTRATVAYLNTGAGKTDEEKLYAFLSLFHPEMTHQEKMRVVHDSGAS